MESWFRANDEKSYVLSDSADGLHDFLNCYDNTALKLEEQNENEKEVMDVVGSKKKLRNDSAGDRPKNENIKTRFSPETKTYTPKTTTSTFTFGYLRIICTCCMTTTVAHHTCRG
jgi:hypothetical protein